METFEPTLHRVAPGGGAVSVLIVVFPIALTIVAGWAARASGLVPDEHWRGVETLSFRVLIPAILVFAIARADLSPDRIGPLALSLVTVCFLVGLAVLALRLTFRNLMGDPSWSTVFQTSTRWNAFVSLAAADLMAGADGVLLVAVSMAVLVPLINIGNVFALVSLLDGETGPRRLARTLLTNPLIIGCLLGLAINFMLGGLPGPIDTSLEIVGRAALGVGLLTVGAGIEAGRLTRVRAPIALGCALRPFGATVLFLAVAMLAGLSEIEKIVGVLVMSVPAASNGYIVAKAMGGDAELYADILAWQILLSLGAIPLFLYAASL